MKIDFQILYFVFMVIPFVFGLYVVFSTNNILKKLLAFEILLCSVCVLLNVWQNALLAEISLYIAIIALVFGICGLIITRYVFKKFKTLDIAEIFERR